MTATPDTDVMNAALTRYRERLVRLFDLIPKDEAYLLMAYEADYIVKAGPEAYLFDLRTLDKASVLVDLDAHLDRTLARILDGGREP